MREDGIGADQLVLAGDQRPGRGEVVVLFAVDDRIGTRFAELGLFERADVGRVGGFGNRLGEACGDLVAVEFGTDGFECLLGDEFGDTGSSAS